MYRLPPSGIWLLALLAMAAVGPRAAIAGAWLRAPGAWYVKTAGLWFSTTDRWDCEGASVAAEPFGGRYRERLALTYVEWGATERVSLVGSFGFKDAQIVEAAVPDYGTRSTTDLRLGARLGLLRRSTPVSVEWVVSLPTYERTDPTLAVGQRAQYLPAGSGRVETELRLQVGRSLFPLPLYANLDLGYRVRGGEFGNQWLVAAEAGGQAGRLFGKVELRGILPTGELCASSSAGSVSFQERSWRWGPEFAYRLHGSLWLGVGAGVPIAGRNALEGTQWAISVAWQNSGRD